jgi:hypothetical protein
MPLLVPSPKSIAIPASAQNLTVSGAAPDTGEALNRLSAAIDAGGAATTVNDNPIDTLIAADQLHSRASAGTETKLTLTTSAPELNKLTAIAWSINHITFQVAMPIVAYTQGAAGHTCSLSKIQNRG